jgi:hypothetical protein
LAGILFSSLELLALNTISAAGCEHLIHEFSVIVNSVYSTIAEHLSLKILSSVLHHSSAGLLQPLANTVPISNPEISHGQAAVLFQHAALLGHPDWMS